MQRAGRTLPASCRLGQTTLLGTHRSCAVSTRRGPIPRLKRHVSTGVRSLTHLPAFEFLHPPIVRKAVYQTRRIRQQVRRYSDDAHDDHDPEHVDNPEVRQDLDVSDESNLISAEESASREELTGEYTPGEDFGDDEPAGVIMSWEDAMLEEPQETDDPNYCPHLNYGPAKYLVNFVDHYLQNLAPFDVPTQYKDAVQSVIDIMFSKRSGRQQEVIDLYKSIQLFLPDEYKFHLARYLYLSTRRDHLEALLSFGIEGRLKVPLLCRLGKREEARTVALRTLSGGQPGVRHRQRNEMLTVLDEYAKQGDWQELLAFWEEAVMTDAVINPSELLSVYSKNSMLENCLVLRAADIKDWYYSKASAIITDPTADPKLCEWIKHVGSVIVKGFAKNARGPEVVDLLKYNIGTFGEIEAISFFWELYSLRKQGRPHDAIELYLAQKRGEFELVINYPHITEDEVKHHMLNLHNEAMASASALNNFQLLREIFEDLYKVGLEPSEYSYSIVMHAFARHGQANTVQQLFDMYVRTGKRPNAYIFAELLYVHVILLDIPAVERTFKLIREKGIDLNLIVYDMLVSAYSRTRDVETCLRIFRTYVKEVGKPDVALINHLINAFAFRNDSDAAVEMFNLMGQYGLAPSIYSFNSLLNAYANTDDEVNAEAVIAKMRELYIEPDVVTWTTMMKIYAKRGGGAGIIDLFARMRRNGVQPNEITWYQLMQSMAFSDSPQADVNVRRVMKRVQSLGFTLNTFHWNAYLTAIIKVKKDLAALQEAYDEMVKSGVKPNTMTHLILVSSYCQYGGRAGQDIAEGIISRLTSIEQHIDLTSTFSPKTTLPPTLFNSVFKVQGPKLPTDQVQRVFDAFLTSAASVGGTPAEPNLDLLTQLIEVYRQHGDLEACRRTWIAIKKHADNASRSFRSISVDDPRGFVVPGNKFLLDWPLDSYISALSSANALDEIDRVWDQLVENGYDFTSKNWNTRIRICIAHKKHIVWAFRACEEVLMDGWEKRFRIQRKRVQNPPRHIREARRRQAEVKFLDRVFWPIEEDILDVLPRVHFEGDVRSVEYWIYDQTLTAFLGLRKELLMGASIVDSSGRIRPGPEVWDRLKTAFPRLVRAMFIHLKKMSKKRARKLTEGLDVKTIRYAQSG